MFLTKQKTALIFACCFWSYCSIWHPQQVKGQELLDAYSQFGLGSAVNGNFARFRGAEALEQANIDSLGFSLNNPASLANLRLTSFETGMRMQFLNQSMGEQSLATETYNFNYLSLAFPVFKRVNWAAAIGFAPEYQQDFRTLSAGEGINIMQGGEGGLTAFYLSQGIGVHPNLSIGVKTSFLFGNYERFQTQEYTGEGAGELLGLRSTRDEYLSGFAFDLGLQYQKSLKNEKIISAGLNVRLPYELEGRHNSADLSFFRFGDILGISDSINFESESRQRYTMPISVNFGINLMKYRSWKYGLQIGYEDWETFNSSGRYAGVSYARGISIGLGAEIVPDYRSRENYFNRVKYRFGTKYAELPFSINGEQPQSYSLTYGMGFPLGKTISMLDIAAEMGLLGYNQSGLTEQTFLNVVIGFRFNDKWFQQRQYD